MTRRLLLSYLGLTIAVLAALEVPLAVNYADRLEDELTSALIRDAYSIAGYSEETVEGVDSLDLGQLAQHYSQASGSRIVIVDKAGEVLGDSQPGGDASFSNRPEVSEALAGRIATGTRHSDTLGEDLLYVAVPIASQSDNHGAVRITYSTAQIQERWRRYLAGLVGITAVSLAAAAGLGVLFARWVARPLDRVVTAAAALGHGDLSVRVSEGAGPEEVRKLATSFNAMASRIGELVSAQEQFVSDASHQLRTPLAALRLRIENLQSDLGEGRQNEGMLGHLAMTAAHDDLEASLQETARLSRIVDGLLALARADRQAGADTAEHLVLAPLLDERVAAWQPLALDQGVTIDCALTELAVRATADRVAQALDNLIANAVDVSPDGGRVRLSADEVPAAHGVGPMVELHVTDQGPGMTAEQRERAFDRFWRAQDATGHLGGTGLGLSIVQKLVRADGGDIELREAPGGGIDAVIRLRRPSH